MQKTRNNILKILTIIAIIIFAIGINAKVQATYNIEDVFKREYWTWHTRTTTDDQAYNGEHIKILDNKIIFYGYGVNSYKDFLYKEFNYTGKKIFKIIVDESKASYHTLEGAGFLINSTIKDNKISGYVLLYGEKTIDLYRIDGINLQTFKTAANSKVSTYGTLVKSINKQTSGIHNVVVEATPTNITVKDNEQTISINLDYSKHVGNSFGLISSYVQHNCSILSTIVFEKLEIAIENYTIPVETVEKDNEEQKLSGAKYEVKNEKGEVVAQGTSNSNGIFNIEGLQEGNYTINQTSAPSGYILNENVVKFTINNEGKAVDITTNEEIKLKFENEKIQNDNKDNTINNNIDNTVITKKPDNTTLQTNLPKTGEGIVTIALIIVGITAITYFAIKIRKYSEK